MAGTIIYKDVLQKLKDAGYNTNRIRQENLLPQSTIQRLRDGGTITTDTIAVLCELTGCEVGDLIEYKKEGQA